MLGAQKNRLIETVLLSSHNICFGGEIKKIVFQYTLLSGGMFKILRNIIFNHFFTEGIWHIRLGIRLFSSFCLKRLSLSWQTEQTLIKFCNKSGKDKLGKLTELDLKAVTAVVCT